MTDLVADLADDAQILPLLERDPRWSAYALCDLDEPYRRHSRFIGCSRGGESKAVVLIYAPSSLEVLLSYGDPDALESILAQAPNLPESPFLIVLEDLVEAIETRYGMTDRWRMLRMVARAEDLGEARPVSARIEALSLGSEPLVAELYRSPFTVEMLRYGPCFGAFCDGTLVSVAGTHALSRRFRIGTIGGVFTLHEFRGRGLATAVTSAVSKALVEQGIELLALNVREDNGPDIAAYRRLGFKVHGTYWEGQGRVHQEQA